MIDVFIVIAVVLGLLFIVYLLYAFLIPDVDGGTPVVVATGPPGI
jgi:phage shock protein PspC (stress-responsive transcriptional regulator)